jgi:hypothetical protein
MRSRLEHAARDVAEGNITLEEVIGAIRNALRGRNLRLANQGAFYNPPEEPAIIELDMEKFNRSAEAIPRGRERAVSYMRNAKPRPTSEVNNNVSSSSVEGTDPSSPIAEPQLLASTPHLAAMTPSRATEPQGSVVQTTVGAYTLLQSYASPFSVAQPAHGQRLADHDPLGIPGQSQHQQASTASIPEPNSTAQ